ncbi:NUDIX hydrolase [Lutibacter holmesii]|uniref:NUDIX hydrolase n=1 Tax=Lutibacter holmesii TaxID=1137985 RepID=A0ABW3WMN4_9FLAO
MYKVFVNDCPIILTENKNISTIFEIRDFNKKNLLEIVQQIFDGEINGICLVCSDLEGSLKDFKSVLKVQEAAGGKVFNTNSEVLFIYRFQKWDLPKGKLEKGESIEECAVREVEEECGINNVTIEKQLETTYHIFQRKNKTIFKITYWFLMHTTFEGELIPQTEEGIEKVVYKNENEISEALTNTYENIKLLF